MKRSSIRRFLVFSFLVWACMGIAGRAQEVVALRSVPVALPDPSFEQGLGAGTEARPYFAPAAWQPIPGLRAAEGVAHTGTHSLTAEGPIAGWGGFFTPPRPIAPGTTLRFEGWIKAENAAGLATLSINWNDGGTYLRHVTAENAAGTHDWQRVTLTATAPEDANHYVLGLRVDGLNGQAWFDDVKLYQLVPQSAHGGRWLFADDFDTDPLAEKRWTFGRGGNCQYAYDTAEHFRGQGSLRAGPGDAMWGRWFCQERLLVQPGRRYRLSGTIKTKDVRHGVPSLGLWFYQGDQRVGAFHTRNVYDPDWTAVEAEGVAPPEAEWAQVICEASGLEGIAWFDALQVLELPQPGVWIERLEVAGSPHGLAPGKSLSATVVLRNPLPVRQHPLVARQLQVHWRLTDLEDRLLWQRTEEVVLAETAVVKAAVGPWNQLGSFHLGLEVVENGICLATAQREVPVLPPLPAKPLPHVPFTVIAANQYALVKGGLTEDEATWRKFARMMRAAGVTNLRIWNHWTDQIHPSDGAVKIQPSIYDLACRVAWEEGLRVSMVFWLVPPWARGPEEDWQCYQFMQEAAKYYAQVGVDRFEIDNEPAATQRYLDRLKAGYLGVKRGNPAAEVLMAGFYWYHRQPHEGLFNLDGTLFNALGELAAPYTDRINWHEYYNQNPPEQPLSRDLAVHRTICDARFAGSYGQSFYMTETAYNAFSPGPTGHVNELEQAQWGVREYLLTLRDCYLDLDNKAFWYYYLDDNGAPYYASAMSGLLRIDMSPKPSYIALRNLASLIEGAEPVGEIDVGEPLKALVLRRGAEPVAALWSGAEPAEIALDVHPPRPPLRKGGDAPPSPLLREGGDAPPSPLLREGGDAPPSPPLAKGGPGGVTLIDLFGNRREVPTQGGKLAVFLNGSVQYVLGADPTAVFAPALTNQLRRLQGELAPLFVVGNGRRAVSLLGQLAQAQERYSDRSLRELADAAEQAVWEMVEEIAAGKLTVREAGPCFDLLRVADACRIGRVLLFQSANLREYSRMEKLQLEKAVAEAERLEEQAVAAIGPLSGQIRARTFLQLGQRRLARACWQSVGNGRRAVPAEDVAVNVETARLATRDLRLALRLAQIEPNPCLDVWLSSPRYELQATSGAVEFPVAVHNASDTAVEGEFVLQAPPGWQVRADAPTFRVEPQQRLVIPFHAQPVGNGRRAVPSEGLGVLRVTARVGGQDTTPIALGLEVTPGAAVR